MAAEDLPALLRAARLRLPVARRGQEAVARAASERLAPPEIINASQLSTYENGRIVPEIPKLLALADVLGVSPDDALTAWAHAIYRREAHRLREGFNPLGDAPVRPPSRSSRRGRRGPEGDQPPGGQDGQPQQRTPRRRAGGSR